MVSKPSTLFVCVCVCACAHARVCVCVCVCVCLRFVLRIWESKTYIRKLKIKKGFVVAVAADVERCKIKLQMNKNMPTRVCEAVYQYDNHMKYFLILAKHRMSGLIDTVHVCS